jgi:hypothetical protein
LQNNEHPPSTLQHFKDGGNGSIVPPELYKKTNTERFDNKPSSPVVRSNKSENRPNFEEIYLSK